MKRYIVGTSINDEDSVLMNIDKIESIIYVEDLEEFNNYDSESMTTPSSIAAAKKTHLDYSTMTREQLLELKSKNLKEFDKIRNTRVLLHTLQHDDLTLNQLRYIENNKQQSRNVNTSEVKHVLKVIRDCHDLYRVPSIKNQEFSEYLAKFGITLRQADVENILHNLHIQDFSDGRYSTDTKFWGHSLIVFEFRDNNFKFACGKSLPKAALPFRIYIKIDTNILTDNSVAIVSFHQPEYSMPHPINYPIEDEKPETWK